MWNRTTVAFMFAVSRIFRQLCCVHCHSLNCKVAAQHNAGVYKQENSHHTFFFFPGGGAGGQGQPKTLFQIQFKMCMSLCVLFLLHTQKLQTIFMYGTSFHMGKSLMGIIRLKRAGRLCQEMV